MEPAISLAVADGSNRPIENQGRLIGRTIVLTDNDKVDHVTSVHARLGQLPSSISVLLRWKGILEVTGDVEV